IRMEPVFMILGQSAATAAVLAIDAGQAVQDVANPYGWLPYLVLPNNPSGAQFWGESDLDDLMGLCQQLNTRVSALADILELAGWPVTVLENVDSAEGITIGPGARWELPEGARAYLLNLLEGGGVEQHVAYLRELRTSLHDLAETPRTAFGESGRAVAGVALEVELQPLIQKVKRKRRGLESLYRRRNAMLLDLMERFGAAPIGGLRRTVAVWPPILPSDRVADTDVGIKLVKAKVRSRRSVAADLGEADPDAEMERIEAEAGGGSQSHEDEDEDDAPEGESEDEAEGAESDGGREAASEARSAAGGR
ncbi:MAG: phage portal protein, partial [Thermomicrobiales bacterium]|nr:phage portal protein [Thermomicrobiales bacterium]